VRHSERSEESPFATEILRCAQDDAYFENTPKIVQGHLVPPAGFEPATPGLGNPNCVSITFRIPAK
jgi:hypothetical protein